MKKIPAVTLTFWIMKVCATTLGETAGDLISMTLRVGYAISTLILGAFFVVTLGAQLAAKRYLPWVYWAVILATSTAGTTMSDFMDRSLGLGYVKGSLLLLCALIGIFSAWRLTGGSLAVDREMSRKTELFYWSAILVSNTLGTALGDFLADSSGLGFAGGAALVASLLIVVIVLKGATNVPVVILFWLAFVLTRPLGATVGDVLTKSRPAGGLGLGTVGSSTVLAGVLFVLIIYEIRVMLRLRAEVA